jgi:hypothetical protein
LSLVLPGGVTAAQVEDVLGRAGGALLERLAVLDEYRGPAVPAGTRAPQDGQVRRGCSRATLTSRTSATACDGAGDCSAAGRSGCSHIEQTLAVRDTGAPQ